MKVGRDRETSWAPAVHPRATSPFSPDVTGDSTVGDIIHQATDGLPIPLAVQLSPKNLSEASPYS